MTLPCPYATDRRASGRMDAYHLDNHRKAALMGNTSCPTSCPVPSIAEPSLPTEPGVYTDKDGDVWRVTDGGKLVYLHDSTEPALELGAPTASAYAPFVKLTACGRAPSRPAIASAEVKVTPVLDPEGVDELTAVIRELALVEVSDALAAVALPGPDGDPRPLAFLTLEAYDGTSTIVRVDRVHAIHGDPSGSAVYVDGLDVVGLDTRSPEELLEAMADAYRAAYGPPRVILGADFAVDSEGVVSERLMLIP